MTDRLTLINHFHTIKQTLDTLNDTHGTHAKLLAVSKTKPVDDILSLYEAGQRQFGENYLQEGLQKIRHFVDLGITDIVWHYIGHIQRNKTRDIAMYFDWVQTVERDIIAQRLNDQRPDHRPPLNVLIQINIDDEPNKSGCQIDDIDSLIDTIIALPKLTLRGLMIIPAKEDTDAFVRTKRLFDDIKHRHQLDHFDTLSMGMSGDMAKAIAQGSTMVRVGSAIFGARQPKNP